MNWDFMFDPPNVEDDDPCKDCGEDCPPKDEAKCWCECHWTKSDWKDYYADMEYSQRQDESAA